MKIKSTVLIVLSIALINGCGSTPRPTSQVGIVNGKYAIQNTVYNNNKGKKVNLTSGQSYNCEKSFSDKEGKLHKITFDLKFHEDGKRMTWHNKKIDGEISKNSVVRNIVLNKEKEFVETTRGKIALSLSPNNSGTIAVFDSSKEQKKLLKLNKKIKNGEINHSEWQASTGNIKVIQFTCTQTTNNSYRNTRYLTSDEIDAYKHNQQLAMQQRTIDSANYNASMGRLQNQSAQINYNTQQMLNRSNTYNVKVY